MFLDLERPEYAYLLGFLLGDGHLHAGRGQKGRLTVELASVDADHLLALSVLLPGSRLSRRQRSTNFSQDHSSAVLSCCRLDVRRALLAAGMPAGRKDDRVGPPGVAHSERDFARGLVDADGSLGSTASGLPFLSLVTTSPTMARWWSDVLLRVSGATRTSRPNRRDGAMNIVVMSDPAVSMIGWLYRDGDLALPRKAARAAVLRDWQRPPGMRARSAPRRWTAEEDAVVLARGRSQAEVARLLGRTVRSVNMRSWRLSGQVRSGSSIAGETTRAGHQPA